MDEDTRRIFLTGDAASSKSFLLSKNGTFMFLFCNGAFGSKWTGLWHNNTKFVEYLAFRVNGKWLSPENFNSIKYNGITVELTYDIGEKIKQSIIVGPGNLAIKIQSNKNIEVDLELGMNIRKRNENIHNRKYTVTTNKGLRIKNSLGSLKVDTENSQFTPMNLRERHSPGRYANSKGYDWQEDEQEKFVPGIISKNGKNVEFNITINTRKQKTFQELKKENRSYIRKLEKISDWKTAVSCSNFITRIEGKPAFFAGFPYFNEFWTRDFLWMVKPLLKKGFEEEVKGALELIGKHQLKDGNLPNIVGKPTSNADSTPLWIIAINEYAKHTGKFIQQKKINRALEIGLTKGLISHPENLTWMDTLHRPKAIEIQSLWVEALENGSELLNEAKFANAAETLWSKIEDNYFKDFFKDSLSGPYQFTANSLMPLFFKQASLYQKKQTLKKAKNELLTEFGVKAVSKNESSNPEKYHERVWGLSTYWASECFGKATSQNIIENFKKLIDKQIIFGIPETNSNGKPRGASHQLWSTAFIPTLLGGALEDESFNVGK